MVASTASRGGRAGEAYEFGTARNYAGGEWVDPTGMDLLDVLNPATGGPIARVVLSSKAEVERVVALAQDAYPAWRATPPVERARYLFRQKELMEGHFEELARLITQDHGKTLEDARGEVRRAIENVEVACG
ncbi:MAG TPA: aldehyde dehydrogenase family protein, partial [Chloroflexota bacterium]|nr:aldehyde dehydrogenase family protein [Chloroflexota bacterium]